MNFEKLWKKTLKHVIFYSIAIITSITFLSYVIGINSGFEMLAMGPVANFGSYAGLLIFSGAFYFVFAFFREQVCTIAEFSPVDLLPQITIVWFSFQFQA